MEAFVLYDKVRTPDGEGGFTTVWTESGGFIANARFDSSMQARIGEAQGVTSLYTITTKKAIFLDYHDVVKRVSDQKVFRVTSDGSDNKTPNGAGLNMRQVNAEEWSIPT